MKFKAGVRSQIGTREGGCVGKGAAREGLLGYWQCFLS